MIVPALQLGDAKPSATPGAKEVSRKREVRVEEDNEEELEMRGEEEPMDSKEAARYRALVAKLNYIAPDRTDLQYAVKEAARSMSNPTQKDWRAALLVE